MQTKFKIGEVISVGLRIWARNLLPFLVLTAVMESPIILWGISVAPGASRYSHDDFHRVIRFQVISLFTLPLRATLLSALLTYGVVMELQGRRVSIFACIASGLSRLPSALLAMVAGFLCLGLAYFVAAIPGALFAPWCSALTGGLAALYFGGWLYVAPQAAVIDRSDANAALVRSNTLTRGHRLALSGLLFVLFGVAYGTSFAIARVAWNLDAMVRFDLAANVIIGSIIATLPSVAYYYLRAEKEGSSAEELGRVFD